MIRSAGTPTGQESVMPVRKQSLAALCLPAALFVFSLPSFAQDPSGTPELAPVVVTATRQETRANEVLADVTVIERAEIERTGQGTIVDLLARQPGIQTSTTGGPGSSGSFFIRGANSNQSKILLDGVSINSIDGSGSPLRFIPLDTVERIEILRGPASMLYGADALGGVINIITRRAQPGLHFDGFIGYGSQDTQRINAGVSGGDEHWRFRVEGNHYRTDAFSAQRHARHQDADDDGYRNTGGAVSLSFLPAQGHEIGVSYRENEGLVHYDSGNTPPDSDYDFRARFRVEQWRIFSKNRFHEKWLSTLQIGFAEDYQKSYAWNAWGLPPSEEITKSRTRNQQFSWQNDIDLPLGKALLMAEHLKQDVHPNNANYSHTPEIDNTSFLAGWSANTEKHRWQLNVRHDNHSEFGSKTTYGASYGYQFTEALRAYASYGTAFRAPTIIELYRPGWGGNPDLKPEESKNIEAGLTWEQNGHLASVVYYHNRVRNLISYLCDASWNCENENVNKALLEGVTLTWQGKIGTDWRFGAVYDWLNAKNQSKDPTTGGGYERLGRRAQHRATLSLDYIWNKLDVGLELIATSNRYDRNYLKTATNKEKLGGYSLVNLLARYALTKDLSLEGRLDNLFDKKYETARGYNMPGFTAFAGLRYSPH